MTKQYFDLELELLMSEQRMSACYMMILRVGYMYHHAVWVELRQYTLHTNTVTLW